MTGTCPVCSIETDDYPCHTCGVPHHSDCWDFNEGCGIFGCGSSSVEKSVVDKRPPPRPDMLPGANTYVFFYRPYRPEPPPRSLADVRVELTELEEMRQVVRLFVHMAHIIAIVVSSVSFLFLYVH